MFGLRHPLDEPWAIQIREPGRAEEMNRRGRLFWTIPL
jgi:hypothetical protein